MDLRRHLFLSLFPFKRCLPTHRKNDRFPGEQPCTSPCNIILAYLLILHPQFKSTKGKSGQSDGFSFSFYIQASPVMPRASPVQSPRKHPGSPQIIEADAEDFSRRLNISSSKRPAHTSPRTAHSSAKNNKLFNPQTDLIPMRHTAEPESISDATSSSYAPRGMSINPSGPLREASAHQRQLFDHRKDDPVRFSVLPRPSSTNGNRPVPTPKSSADYVSASSTSSYAHSQVSSNFTLSSNTTDGSSASSAVFDRPNEEHRNNAFTVQLKSCIGVSWHWKPGY